MNDAELDELATRWWVCDGTDDSYDIMDRWVSDEWEDIPAFIRAAVRTVPSDRDIGYLGTSIIEDLHFAAKYHDRRDRSLELLVATGLPADQLADILAGVYPKILLELDLERRLGEIIPADKIAWLLDRDAPGRGDWL